MTQPPWPSRLMAMTTAGSGTSRLPRLSATVEAGAWSFLKSYAMFWRQSLYFFRPPNGCLQYFVGGTGRIQTYNFDSATETHLPRQRLVVFTMPTDITSNSVCHNSHKTRRMSEQSWNFFFGSGIPLASALRPGSAASATPSALTTMLSLRPWPRTHWPPCRTAIAWRTISSLMVNTLRCRGRKIKFARKDFLLIFWAF